MKRISDKSIDMILCDLPYGTTKCKWDTIIPFELLWKQYGRIIKDNGAIVLFGSQPFTTDLINSNRKMFKYELIWNKIQPTGATLCNIQPMKNHENIIVFGKGKITYNPQMELREKPLNTKNWKMDKLDSENGNFSSTDISKTKKIYDKKYPRSIIEFHKSAKECNNLKRIHPTQKPIDLFEYLIKTYSNENETVLDNCIGSGTTAIASINTNRKFIGFELDNTYYNLAKNRVNNHIINSNLQDKYKIHA